MVKNFPLGIVNIFFRRTSLCKTALQKLCYFFFLEFEMAYSRAINKRGAWKRLYGFFFINNLWNPNFRDEGLLKTNERLDFHLNPDKYVIPRSGILFFILSRGTRLLLYYFWHASRLVLSLKTRLDFERTLKR